MLRSEFRIPRLGLVICLALVATACGFIADPDPIVSEERLYGSYYHKSCPAITYRNGFLEFNGAKIEVEYKRTGNENVLLSNYRIEVTEDTSGCKVTSEPGLSEIHFVFDDQRVMIVLGVADRPNIRFFEKSAPV